MKRIKLRRAEPSDAPVLAKIHVDAWHAAYGGFVPESFLERFTYQMRTDRFRQALIDGTEETYVVSVAEEAVGILTIGTSRDEDLDPEQTGEIWGIYLAPAHWRKGIGTQAVERGEEMLKSRGYQDAVLWVFKDNQSARRFYEAMGFKPDGKSKILELDRPLEAVRYRKRFE